MTRADRIPPSFSRFRGALALALAAASCLFLIAAVGADAASKAPAGPKKQAGATVTIDFWPEGVFGYVRGAPERCAGNRRVELFEQLGEGRDPATDRRLAADRAGGRADLYQWAVRTARPGSLYAFAAKVPGCAAATSASLGPRPLQAPPEREDYPPCSPYVGEGTTFICKFAGLNARFEGGPSFGDGAGNYDGSASGGPAPWGTSPFGGGVPVVNLAWNWSQRWVRFVSYRGDQETVGTAFLSGSMPSATSNRFSISDAFAQNDRGREIGEHFYTPDLPGQEAGEVGGPLNLNFVHGSTGPSRVYVDGYLYLRRW